MEVFKKMNINLLVEGGAMKPGPTLSQKLGPTGIPINKVIDEINKETSSFKGMKVPVEIKVDLGTKTFEIQIFSPPASGLLKKEAGIESGSGLQKKLKSGNISIEQVISVAKSKMANLLCKDLKTAVKTIVGSCASLGILVENMEPKEIERLIDEGKFDKEINGQKTETPEEKKKSLKEFYSKIKEDQDKKLKAEAAQKEEAAAASATAATEKAPSKAPAKVTAKAPAKK